VAAPEDPEQRLLVSGLDLPPWSELVWLSPLRDPLDIERALAQGELDGAVLATDAVARARDPYELIPGLAVGCAGPSGVMQLLHRGALEGVERILVPAAGHAAETLARLLFAASGSDVRLEAWKPVRRELGTALTWEEAGPETAVLLTGEHALVTAPAWAEQGWCRLDLGQAWHALTGHPFVWAAWAVRPGTVSRRLYGVLHGARTRGKHRMPELVESVLGGRVRYRLGNREIRGLRHFWDEAARHGLLPADVPLRLLPLAAGSACRTPPPKPR
jgi:predicted solute-binding protein